VGLVLGVDGLEELLDALHEGVLGDGPGVHEQLDQRDDGGLELADPSGLDPVLGQELLEGGHADGAGRRRRGRGGVEALSGQLAVGLVVPAVVPRTEPLHRGTSSGVCARMVRAKGVAVQLWRAAL